MKRGQQRRIPVPTDTHHRCYVLGAYDWHTDCITSQIVAACNTHTFVAFLIHLFTEVYPDQRLVLVLDNASYHKGMLARAALSLFEHRVLLLYLPPYCSHLNPIERFWRHLKDRVCIDKLFPDLELLTQSLQSELTRQNDVLYSARFAFSKNQP